MSLAGIRVLVVEDEAIIALAIEDMLIELGCQIVGPALSVDAAARLASGEALDAAVLDINLRGETSRPVAEILRGRDVPFCFSTGYESADVPDGFESVPLLRKPYTSDSLGAMLRMLLSAERG
ncbi:MAG: response regulator [Bacillota bacterium]